MISDDTADDSEDTEISGEIGGATVVPYWRQVSVSYLNVMALALPLLMKRGKVVVSPRSARDSSQRCQY